MKHRLTLTVEELAILEERLAYVKPVDYDLRSFALLRGLYGRVVTLHAKAKRRQLYLSALDAK